MMIDEANTQRITTEKSTTPPPGGISATHVRESSLLTESRVDEEEWNRNLAIHQFSEVSLGLNASITASAAEKSFKREDYIYVSFFPRSFYLWIFKMMVVFL